jgi:N-acetylglucosamine malate deacetylase 1
MTSKRFFLTTLVLLLLGSVIWQFNPAQATQAAQARKLRIISFGAHPDDAEIGTSGTAALWAAQGHAVKLVAVTNGDIGHWKEAGGELYRRRKAEV